MEMVENVDADEHQIVEMGAAARSERKEREKEKRRKGEREEI